MKEEEEGKKAYLKVTLWIEQKKWRNKDKIEENKWSKEKD